ncbi:MAG: PQQ-binding-like beta-propeller repeat protein [Planctomycetes bacterium]|nr:PQQ-binding-like beta-propeller repeat protein [Planctomycetota bacterium]
MIESIAHPWAFLVLLLVPLILYRAARSYADRSRAVKAWIGVVRSAICVLLIVELAGVTVWWSGRAGEPHVAYIVDVSDSISLALRKQALEQVLAALDARGTTGGISLIFFGESSHLAIAPGGEATSSAVRSAFAPFLASPASSVAVSGKRTDLARAVRQALAGFPADAQKKVILLTDGNETDGDVVSVAQAAGEQGVSICPVPLMEESSRDVVLGSIGLPERVKRDEAFEIRCDVRSASPAAGRLKLYIDDILVDEKEVKLPRGPSIEVFRRSLDEGGDHLVRVQFEADFPQPGDNDAAFSYLSLPGRPRVLLVGREEHSALQDALAASRFLVERRSPVGAPATLLGLIRYDAIVIENVPASDFGENHLRLLRDYVRELGGGLVLTGGPESFGPGGYSGTPLEEASPLVLDISAEERPSTAVILAVDDSRSVWLHGTPDLPFTMETFGTPPKHFNGLVTLGKARFIQEVFKRVVLSLSARDQVGALGMSSDLLPARWYVRVQRVTDKERLIQEFQRSFDRRTYSVLYPTLDEARFFLSHDPSTYRQILLLSDGFVQPDENYRKFAMMLLSDGVALSTVGVGGDSNEKLLEEMARWGGGRFYSARDLSQIGEVYEKELQAPERQLVIERPVSAALVEESPMVTGLDLNLAPSLFGYVRTRPKARAQMPLVIEGTNDPLLASWTLGAGRVAAFTSSASGSWATLWVKDWEDGYVRFWRQLVGTVLKEPGKQRYRLHLVAEGLRLRVHADVLDENENFVNGAAVSARVYYLGERGDVFSPAVSWSSPLRQAAPGRYEHEFTLDRPGVYVAGVLGQGESAGAIETAGAILSAPKELLEPVPNEKLLREIARVTRGAVSATAAEALAVRGQEERRRHDLGLPAMVVAALLLVLEVLVRRWPAVADFRRRRLESKRPAPAVTAVSFSFLLLMSAGGPALGEESSTGEGGPASPGQPAGESLPASRTQTPAGALSPSAQKAVERYMNLVLEDPRNEFAFEQVYSTYESEKKTWQLLDFFINASRLQRENGNLQILLGLTYYKFRDYYKAAEHFRSALKLLPNDFYARWMLGRVYLKQADGGRAQEHLAEAVKVATGLGDRVEALLLLGEALILAGSRDEALKAWSEVLEIQRYDRATLQRLAEHYEAHGFLDKADEMLREVLALEKRNSKAACEAHLRRSGLQVKRGDRGAAIECLRSAQGLLLPDSALRQEVEVRIRQLYREEGRLAEFFEELEKRVRERPQDVGLRKEIARLYAEEGRTAEAVEHVERGLELESRDVPLLEQAVELHLRQGAAEQGIERLGRLDEVTGHVPAYRIRQGDILWEQGKKEEAVRTWKEMMSVDPASFQRQESAARAFRLHGVKEEAVACYRRMVELDAVAQDARLALGDYLLELGRTEEATAVLGPLTSAVEAAPTVFLQVAEAYGRHDLDERALDVLVAASQRHSGDFRVWKRLGLAQERLQKYGEAMDSFVQAYDRAPNWREREVMMDKLISLHLAYGNHLTGEGQGGYEGLGRLVLKLQRDIQANPEDAEPYVSLARTALVSRPTAETAFRGQAIFVPGLNALSEAGADYFPMGPMSAIAFYTQALERAPMRLDAYEGLARSFMLFDEFEKAVIEYKKLAIVNPVGKWKYYFTIGDYFASQGQMPEARAFWDRVAERAFTDATLYFRLATRYHWADRPEKALELLRKAIALHPDDYRYHLALGNLHTERKEFVSAVSEYRKALQLSTQTMLHPVQKTMSEAQLRLARDHFRRGRYPEALEVYLEVQRYQDLLRQDLGYESPDSPDVQMQILRMRGRLADAKMDAEASGRLAARYPEATCWVTDSLSMALGHFSALDARGGFQPNLEPASARSARPFPALRTGFSVRLHPWILHPTLCEGRLIVAGKKQEVELDPSTGQVLAERERQGYVRFFGDVALRSSAGKVVLSEVESGRVRWEVALPWAAEFKLRGGVAVGVGGGKLQALDVQTGGLLWEVPACVDFDLTESYVALKRQKPGKPASGGGLSLEEAATGDEQAIGYVFQVLDAPTGRVLWEKRTSGTHYWRTPVVLGDRVLLTDEMDFAVLAHDIPSGKLQWRARFESFFAAPPLSLDGKVYLYMRRPKLKTIIQYVLDPETGDILHQTDLQVNSLYARPIPIGETLFFYDPVAYELVGVDRLSGGVTGRYSVREALTEVSRRNVVTLEGIASSIFFTTWDGLILRLDVGKP